MAAEWQGVIGFKGRQGRRMGVQHVDEVWQSPMKVNLKGWLGGGGSRAAWGRRGQRVGGGEGE